MWKLRVYPLYPGVKRFLRVMLAIYLLAFALAGYVTWVTYLQNPKLAVYAGVWGLTALWGVALAVHAYVHGAPPPEGMMPDSEVRHGDSSFWFKLPGKNKPALTLSGDAAQPVDVVVPLWLIVILSLLPACALTMAVMSLVAVVTNRNTYDHKAVRHLRVLAALYGVSVAVWLGVMLFGRFNGDDDLFNIGFLFMMLSMIGLLPPLLTVYTIAALPEDSTSSATYHIEIFQFRWQVEMHGALLVYLLPLGLMFAVANVLLLVVGLR